MRIHEKRNPGGKKGEELKRNDGELIVYGYSTEGYMWASAALSKGLPTVMVDERLQIFTEITKEIVSSFPNLESLAGNEVPLSLRPSQEVSKRARYVVFAPRIRGSREEARREVLARLKDMGKYLSKEALIVSLVPSGLGDNSENLQLISRVSGLDEIPYIYMPARAENSRPLVAGVSSPGVSRMASGLFRLLGWKTPVMAPMDLAELIYLRKVLSDYEHLLLDLEVSKVLKDVEKPDIIGFFELEEAYLDSLASSLFDIYMMEPTTRGSETLRYAITGIVKGMEDYMKLIVESVLGYIKREGIRPSKARVIVAWTRDSYEIRGERVRMISSLVDRIAEYVRDVVPHPPVHGEHYVGGSPLVPEKTNIILACSRRDFEYWSRRKEEKVILRSTLPLFT